MRFTRFFIALLLPLAMVSCAEEDLPEVETDPRIKFTGNWTVSEETAGVSTGNVVATAVFRPPTGTTKVLIGAVPQYSIDAGYGMFNISTTANTLIGKFMKPTLNVSGDGSLTNNPNNSSIIVGVWDYTTSNYAFAATENNVSTAGIAYVLII